MTPVFRDWIERARSEHVGAVLNSRHIMLPGKGDRRAGPCPKCGGEDRFAVDLKKEVFNCRGCEGKGHGAISLVMFLDGVNFLQAVETITGEPPPKDAPKEKPQRAKKARGRLVCTYDYTDELDVEQYQVCRYAEPKSFSQRRPDPDHEGEWISDLNGVRLVPYHLSDLMEGIANEHPVYWVEGEKDAENGAKLGLVTTTTAMGLAGKGHWERGVYDEFFRGACIILVPDQDADPKKGGELARVIARRLKPIADVWLLNLPTKDLSDWIEAGGTREALDAMPLDRPVDTNGNGHAEHDIAFDREMPGATVKTPPKPDRASVYTFPDPAKTPGRSMMYGEHYFRDAVTGTVAPGGFGKTTLHLYEALTMAQQGLKVWYISGEDPRVEIDRRIAAHVQHHDADTSLIAGHLFVDDRDSFPIKFTKSARGTTVDFDEGWIAAFEHAIERDRIDVIIIDPLVAFHTAAENDNSAMDAVVKRLGLICVKFHCNIEMSHHVRKPSAAMAEITVDDARGGGALVNATRSCRVINRMPADIAAQEGIKPEKRSAYLRLDSGKRNMAPAEAASWWQLVSVLIANKLDNVQAIERYKLKGPFDSGWQVTDTDAIVAIVKQGNSRAYPQSDQWLGHEVIKRIGIENPSKQDIIRVNAMISKWIKNKLFKKAKQYDPEDRKERSFYVPIDSSEEGQ